MFACPCACGMTVVWFTTGTRTSKHPDSNPQATQPIRRHTICKPDGREHGHAHYPHPRRAQPASAIGPYDPCKTANAATAILPGGILWHNSELSPWLARHNPLGEGNRQARSVLRPEQGTEQGMLPRHATQGLKQKPVPTQHKETQGNTQATATAQYTHSSLLESFNRPMAAARRRQWQQLYAWHGTPTRRPQAAPPFPLTPAGEAIQPQPAALPPEAWPCECNTN